MNMQHVLMNKLKINTRDKPYRRKKTTSAGGWWVAGGDLSKALFYSPHNADDGAIA